MPNSGKKKKSDESDKKINPEFTLLDPATWKTKDEPYPGWKSPNWTGSAAFRTWFSRTAAILMTLMMVAVIGLFAFVNHVSNVMTSQTQTNRENGYKNRAVLCTTIINNSHPVPGPCNDAQVRKYMDPVK